MSPQFAGVATALTNGLYEQNDISLNFLPICSVGEEMKNVREAHDAVTSSTNSDGHHVHIGSVEQNIFIPTLYHNPNLKVKAIAAMFRKSPLCLASISSPQQENDDTDEITNVVGAHEDTVPLLKRILSTDTRTNRNQSVVASPRATKNQDLLSGTYQSIQAYTTTEVPTLQRELDEKERKQVIVNMLEGMNGAKLGYSQVLFAPEEHLIDPPKREVLSSFCDATFQGWRMAIRDHEHAAKCVQEARASLGLDEEENDHWVDSGDSFEYMVQSVGLCCDHVKETFEADRYGTIQGERWNDATDWLLQGVKGDRVNTEENFGLDNTVWKSPSRLLGGNELARTTLEGAKQSAIEFNHRHDRKPSLAVITLGELSRYKAGNRRLQIYSNNENSWFNKTHVGESNGFEVKEINLPESTSQDELESLLYSLQSDGGVDGIQLMWPLPSHIDQGKMYNMIDVERDVDGAHYVGQKELSPKINALPPVTPNAVMDLIDHYGVELVDKKVVVIGKSRIVGSPLAYMLLRRGAIVTTVHSQVSRDNLKSTVESGDIIVSCAGSPGIIDADWVQPHSTVINVGTNFCEDKDALISDFDGDLSHCLSVTPVPGGIGPLSVAHLFKNVAKAAWDKKEKLGTVEQNWKKRSGALCRSIHFQDYDSALAFANKVNTMSSDMDHHANMSFSHKCINGVDLDLEFFTYEANEVTEKDYRAASNVDQLLFQETGQDEIKMKDFTYNLKMSSIAKYPAEPRGSSRLLRVDSNGEVSHYANFTESFHSLIGDAHIVFNESRVANARLSVKRGTDESIEMMVLDLGGNTISRKCNGTKLNVMLRQEGVQLDEVYEDDKEGKFRFKVVEVVGPWIEDDHSNGMGTECIVECIGDEDATLSNVFESVGKVPIPPYLNREAESKDEESYNNVYAGAESCGSVAAPTAGLHFTDDVLAQIGPENISYLTLHVGAGTFKPVSTEDARDHSMHSEIFSVHVGELQSIINSLSRGKRLVVVGTTSSRTLESLYWCGVKQILKENGDESLIEEDMMSLGQHEWLELSRYSIGISPEDALKSLIKDKNSNNVVEGKTSLMIVPGSYDFKVVNELVTNFHAPDSTLMLLVSAFLGSGDKVRQVYEDAQELGYRFLSYGDVCLFSRSKKP